jgi:hypothetical protein
MEVRLAQLRQTGSGVYSRLSNAEVDRVIANLGLRPMSGSEKVEIYNRLAVVNGYGHDEIARSKKLNPDNRLQVEDIVATLMGIARHLNAVDQPLRGCQTGLRDAHDIQVALKLREFLAMNPEIGPEVDVADNFLSDFCTRSKAIAHACSVAATDLKRLRADPRSPDSSTRI